MGQALSGSRNLFALAEQGDLPRFFGYVHPRFRTPVNAILVTSAVSLVLAMSGRYAELAPRQRDQPAPRLRRDLRLDASVSIVVSGRGAPPTFVVPLGPVIPAVAIVLAISMLAGARREQLIAGTIALFVGGLLYVIAVCGRCRCRVEALSGRARVSEATEATASPRRNEDEPRRTKRRGSSSELLRCDPRGGCRPLAGAQAVAA